MAVIGDDIPAALHELRAHAASRMRATARITRPGPSVTSTSGTVSTPAPTVYQGPCRWKAPTTAAGRNEVGAAILITTPGQVHLPIDNPEGYQPEPGDIVECLTNPERPVMVGRRAAVTSRFDGDDLTALRISIEEL